MDYTRTSNLQQSRQLDDPINVVVLLGSVGDSLSGAGASTGAGAGNRDPTTCTFPTPPRIGAIGNSSLVGHQGKNHSEPLTCCPFAANCPINDMELARASWGLSVAPSLFSLFGRFPLKLFKPPMHASAISRQECVYLFIIHHQVNCHSVSPLVEGQLIRCMIQNTAISSKASSIRAHTTMSALMPACYCNWHQTHVISTHRVVTAFVPLQRQWGPYFGAFGPSPFDHSLY